MAGEQIVFIWVSVADKKFLSTPTRKDQFHHLITTAIAVILHIYASFHTIAKFHRHGTVEAMIPLNLRLLPCRVVRPPQIGTSQTFPGFLNAEKHNIFVAEVVVVTTATAGMSLSRLSIGMVEEGGRVVRLGNFRQCR